MFSRFSKALAGLALLAITGSLASASVYNKKTTLTVKETIEVPGAVLQPGEYVVKLVDSDSNRHIVQFLTKDEGEVLSTVIAIPNSRLEPTGDTEFAWYETPAGQPPALRAWFYPGDNFGQEFAYPEGRATALSQSTHQEVTHVPDEVAASVADREETVIAQAPAPEPAADLNQRQAAQAEQDRQREMQAQRDRETAAQRDREMAAQRERDLQAQRERDMQAQRDRELAQAQQPQPAQPDPSLTAQEPIQSELPDTAGFGALLALVGFGSLGASAVARKLRRR